MINKKKISNKLFYLLLLVIIVVFLYASLSFSLFFFIVLSCVFSFMIIVFILTYIFYPNIAKTRPFPKKAPKIAAVTYAFNYWTPVKKTIKHLKELEYPIPFDVYVITDGTCTFLNKIKGIKVIELPKKYFENKVNVKATVMNIGLKKIKADYIFCVDGDTIPNKDVLMKMTGFMDKNVAVVNGLLLPSNNKTLLEKLQVLEYNFSWGIRLRVLSALNSISVAVGGMCLINKKYFDEVGGYDENNVTEDRELAYRFIRKGYVIRCAQEARGKTKVPRKLKTFIKQRVRWDCGQLTTISKHRDFLFNRKQDIFGLIVLPFTFFSQIIALGLLFRILFVNIRRQLIFIYYYIIFAIQNNVLLENIFTLPNYFYLPSMVIMAIFIFCIFLVFAILAFSFSNFKLKARYFIPFVLFSTIYGALLLIIYFYALIKELIGSGYKWVKS